MEKRINTKTRTYLQQFKNDIKEVVTGLNIPENKSNILLQFVYDYQPVEFTKIDFQKRKRVKNVVPFLKDVVHYEQTTNNALEEKKVMINFAEHIQKEFHMAKSIKNKKNPHIQRKLCGLRILRVLFIILTTHITSIILKMF